MIYAVLNPKLLLVLFALGAVACLSIRRFFVHRQIVRAHGCKRVAKAANKDPFLGIDTIFWVKRAYKEHKLLDRNTELFQTYGNTFRTRQLHKYSIGTIEPENIKTILSLKFDDYGIGFRLEPFKALLGKGIFDTDGDHWAASRALIRPSFTRDQISDLSSLENLFQDLFALLPRDGQTVDLQELFFRYTIDSATEFLFGESVGTLKKAQSQRDFSHAFQYAQSAIITRAMLGPLKVFHKDPKADESNRICREFVQQIVDEAFRAAEDKETKGETETNRQKHIFAQELASRTTDRIRILDELMNVLLAGRDTTASLLGNLFFMLAKNPAMWDKLRQEVAFLQGRPPTYEELRSLRYVHCCMNESLRLHPVVPRNEREAVRDTVLPRGGGKDGLSPVFVPKGTIVGYCVYAMHRRADIYGDDAEEFRPERWEDGKLQPRWGYLPFNGGPRICIGQRYALTEAAYVIARMAQEFKVLESRDTGAWEECVALTLCSRNGAKVSLTPA
ncbi:cytochrome P450 52A3-B [Penicillium longicatenatum]|nr:cytochrome P450 52A3-B [Penicillium longicatenatum]